MGTIELAKKIADNLECDANLRRWADRLQEAVARETLYLGLNADLLPEELRQTYWGALREALSAMPEGVQVEASASLMRLLMSRAPSQETQALLKERVSAPEAG